MVKSLFLLAFLSVFTSAFAACGGTVRTWDAGQNTVKWGQANNWNANDVPNTASEDAVVVAAARPCRSQTSVTIGCLEVESGELQAKAGITLTIQGDYFKNLNSNSLQLDAVDNWYLVMDGSAAQTLENVDPLNYLEVSNDTSVTFTEAFEIRTSFTITGTGTTIYVNDDLTLSFTTGFTIPASATVEVAAGATLAVASDITVNGSLILNAGSSLVMDSGTILTIASGGHLELNGASGNVASISGSGGYIDIAVNGDIDASYFRMDRVGANGNGLEINGTIQDMDYGEFHYINDASYGITLGSAASVPSEIDGVGFYDDSSFGNNYAVNASSYDVSDILFEDWSGISDESDPNDRIDWGTQAGTVLTLSTNTNSGYPIDPVVAGDPSSEFVIFSFALNQISAATDITEVTFTLEGTASSSDVDYIQVFNQGASCQTVGTQIGSDLTMSGDPATATLTIPSSTVTVDSTTPHCIHVYLKTTDSAENSATLGISIDATSDVTNSYGYSFSETSGPPVSGSTVTISGDETVLWKAKLSDAWRVSQNWQNGAYPTSIANCRIGTAPEPILMSANEACQNLTMTSGGEIDWNSGSYSISAYGALNIESGFSFTDLGTSASLVMAGSSNQSLVIGTTFPGNLEINNTGGSSSIISVDGDSAITGNLTVTSGTLRIASGVTLTVGGNANVISGAVLDIEPNGTLKLGDGSSLTVNSGGTLQMIGSSNEAVFTSSGAATVMINGTIQADTYIFDHLGTSGVTINFGATIDSTYSLNNGTFKHPANDNSTLLRLFTTIPNNTLENMTFDMNGSTADSSTMTNIYTDSSISSGTLTISDYTGDLGGADYDNDNSYLIAWSGASNTVDLTQALTGPSSVYQGQTYNMGRFAFKQTLAGASYVDTNITSLTLTLLGTGSANDVDAARIFYDDDCDSASGVQLGSDGTFSGNPATLTFSGLSGATVEADTSNPSTRCIYVEFDIASDATNAATLGVEISSAGDVVDDQGYGISSATPPPVDLGTEATIIGSSTTWTGGAGTTDWFTSGNWNGGVPTASLNCVINSATYNPVIASGTAICKTVTIGNGTLTLSSGAVLEVYGSFDNTGTFNQSGSLQFHDDGSTSSNQTINTTGDSLGEVVIDKDAGGTVIFESTTFSIGDLTMNGANTDYIFQVGTGQTLVLSSGATISGGKFKINSGAVVEVASGSTILVSGGHFWCNGTAESYPQTLGTKSKVTVNGSGTWSFNSTSGTVTLSGFQLDYLDTNGLVIGGTTTLTSIEGGQFTNLSTSYSSVKAIQLNTSGSIPTSSTNVGWNWSPDNTSPDPTDGYFLVYSSGCSAQSIDFSGWFGDWYEGGVETFDVSTTVDATDCTISLSGSATPVSLVSFEAESYNGAVELNWETSLEIDHLGFNIFRKKGTSGDFVQINDSLIRSMALGHQGVYQFIDWDVSNGEYYYYYLQDVAVNGDTTLHGPVVGKPRDGLGMPETSSDEISVGSSSSDQSDEVSYVDYEDLGGGVTLVSKTSNSIRLRIIPGTLNFGTSHYDSNYQTVSIDGYSSMLEAGAPELLEKVVLIEVGDDVKKAIESQFESTYLQYNEVLVTPALSWQSNGEGELESSWAIDKKIYSKDKFCFDEYVEVIKKPITIGGKKYIKVIIHPLNFNPVAQTIYQIESAVLDIGLDGDAWQIDQSDFDSAYLVENSLKLGYAQTGIFRLDYDWLVELGLEGPFENVPIENLKGYCYGIEVPIEVVSDDEYFSSGDYLRFYLKYFDKIDDPFNYAILLVDSYGTVGKRIETKNSNPQEALDTDSYDVMFTSSSEQNQIVQLRDPMGTYMDHFFWKRIYAPYAQFESESYLDIPIKLFGLDTWADSDVSFDLYVKGTHDGYNIVFNHHLGIYVNDYPEMLAEVSFESNDYSKIRFSIPSTYFFDGENRIRVKVLGDLIPDGHYDLVFIDKLVAQYYGAPYVWDNSLSFKNLVRDSVIEVASEEEIDIFDVSDIESVTKMEGAEKVRFGDYIISRFWANSEDGFGRNFVAQIPGNENYFEHLELSYGYQESLSTISETVDMVIIGHDGLLDSLEPLVERRRSEGLTVKTIPVKQIYDEYFSGMTSAEAIRLFVSDIVANWSTRYLLFIGDASYDLKDNLGYGATKGTLPIPLVKGQFYDFPSDNWFGTLINDSSNLPQLSIGRIPVNDLVALEGYVEKLLDYEDSHDALLARQMHFFADSSSSKENFTEDLNSIIPTEKFTSHINSRDLLSDASMHESVINSFSSSALLLGFLGHGAMQFWASRDILASEDVLDLSNNTLPIVASFNCSNADFSDPDQSMTSLGEELVLRENGGAIAFIGSTSMPTPTAQKQFATHLMKQFESTIIKDDEIIRLGDLFIKAKNELGDSSYNRDVQNSYVIIGDPSMHLPEEAFDSEGNSSGLGGGCDAQAGINRPSNNNWPQGIFELFLIFMIPVFFRFARRS